MTIPANEAGDILHQPAYRFCREPTYPWTDGEAAWCEAMGPKNDRCGALPAACQGAMRHATISRWHTSSDHEDSDPFVLKLPKLGPVASFALWALVAVAVVVIVRLVLSRGFGRSGGDRPDGSKSGVSASASASEDARVIESDVERLLARARRAASEGRFADGIDDAYAALLRQLEGERILRIDPWRTNGDYLRDLSSRPEVKGDVARVVRAVEGVQFGGAEPTGERFESVFGAVSALVSAGARALRAARPLAIATLACLALVVASCADRMRGNDEDSPSGTSAVVELLRRSGLKPHLRLRSLSKVIDASQVVLLPGAHLDEASWTSLLHWLEDGGTLIGANGDPRLSRLLGTRLAIRPGLKPTLALGPAVPSDVREASVVVAGASEIVFDTSVDPGARLLFRGDSTYAARLSHDEGEVILLADDRLFTNVSLAMADNAAFLVAMLKEGGEDIDLVGEFTSSGAQNPMASIQRGKLAPLLLQLGVVLALFFVYKGAAFGTLTDPPVALRRSFAEHARAVGLLYAKARASAHARSLFGTYALERLRERTMFREQKGLAALAEAIATRTGEPIGKVTLTLVEAQEPPDPNHKWSHDDLDVIRRLSRLLVQSKGGST